MRKTFASFVLLAVLSMSAFAGDMPNTFADPPPPPPSATGSAVDNGSQTSGDMPNGLTDMAVEILSLLKKLPLGF